MLVFSSVGYLKQEVEVNSRTIINVVLQGESQNLNEVVVVGYGTQRRKDVTSSVSSVKGDVFKDQPITNPVAGLQGRVAGVDIAVTSGAPDAQPQSVSTAVASSKRAGRASLVAPILVASPIHDARQRADVDRLGARA